MQSPSRNIAVTLALVAFALLGVSAWRVLHTSSVKIDRTPIVRTYQAVGERMAEETARLLQDHGQIVVVSDYDHSRPERWHDERWDAFHEVLKKHPGIAIAATEVLPIDPDEGLPPSCSRLAFKELLEKHGQVDAIVFFCDLPEWPRVDGLVPLAMHAKLIAFDNTGQTPHIHYQGYFAHDLLALLFFPKGGFKTEVPPATLREWFDGAYVIVTPTNFDTLPDPVLIPPAPANVH